MNESLGHEPKSRENYAYVTRSLIRLFNEGRLTNVSAIDVEPEYGYVARIKYTDGSYRITYGNDLGLNPGAASDLARDKGHTKFLLRTIGINCPKGEEFLLPWWADQIRSSQEARGNKSIRSVDESGSYIEQGMGYPVYLKPVDGSQGSDIFILNNPEDLTSALELYNQKRVRVAMVEEPIKMPDYRIVALGGELISAYRRIPLAVTGDGSSSIEQLLTDLQARYFLEGRDTRVDPNDPRINKYLLSKGLSVNTKLSEGQQVTLAPISNLSAGGTSEDVTNTINPRWSELAAFVSKNFNLRLCGLDLACQDITNAESEYCVLEVNAAPGLDHYATSGEEQKKIVDELYVRVLNALPSVSSK